MGRVKEFFGNPGIRPDISQQCRFSNQKTSNDLDMNIEEKLIVSGEKISKLSDGCSENLNVFNEKGDICTSTGFTGLEKSGGDRILDKIVDIAGSVYMFCFVWIILILWCILGGISGGSFVWQTVMQDGQSIQSYFWDTLLMRQQLVSAHDHICICAFLRSRITLFSKMLEKSKLPVSSNEVRVTTEYLNEDAINDDLNDENWYDRACTISSKILGSWYSILIFWIGIFIWIGCGALYLDCDNSPPYTGDNYGENPKYCRFGDMWQMYINTAVAVSLLICSTMLQNVRARHDVFVATIVKKIFLLDERIETILRELANDFETDGDTITIEAKNRTTFEGALDWYADIIGTGVGLILAIAVIIVWICIGKPMRWSDDWWLIIGTYTGLVGFFDGFIIRQNYFRIVKQEEINYERVLEEDDITFQKFGVIYPDYLSGYIRDDNESLIYKVSLYVNNICSTSWSVLVSIAIILLLIIVASVMRWNTTGQLIANTPTMIIEEFFLLILLQAHNWADHRRRKSISLFYRRRVFILEHLQGVPKSSGSICR